jgi:hypothetical protein
MITNLFIRAAVKLNEKKGFETIQLDPREMDAAIIGVKTKKRTGKTHLVYSYRRLVKYFMEALECDEEGATEWIEYNTIRAIPYMSGEKQAEPIVKR